MAVQNDMVRIWGRHLQDYTDRYPELQSLEFPEGTILDGELVVVRDGRPDFHALMARHRSWPGRLAAPVQYVVFDMLALGNKSLLKVPLRERREILDDALPKQPLLRRCEGVVGKGCSFFQKMIRQGHEGVVAKRLSSSYTPGRRSDAWQKIKQV